MQKIVKFSRNLYNLNHSYQSILLKSSNIQFTNQQYFNFSSNKNKNYYQILNVSEKATQKEIKAHYHKLAKLYHPDNKNTANEDKFKEISEAYSTLGDEKKRKVYDIDRQQKQGGGRQKTYSGFSHQQYRGPRPNQNNQQQEHYTNAYEEAQKMYDRKDPNRFKYKTKEEYDQFNKSDFEYGTLYEEGFLNTLKKSPELILLTAIIVAITIRWMMLVRQEKENQIKKQREWQQREIDPNAKPFIKLQPYEVQGKSMAELEELTRSGLYQLPQKQQRMVEEYRQLKREADQPFDINEQQYEDDEAEYLEFQRKVREQQKNVFNKLAEYEEDEFAHEDEKFREQYRQQMRAQHEHDTGVHSTNYQQYLNEQKIKEAQNQDYYQPKPLMTNTNTTINPISNPEKIDDNYISSDQLATRIQQKAHNISENKVQQTQQMFQRQNPKTEQVEQNGQVLDNLQNFQKEQQGKQQDIIKNLESKQQELSKAEEMKAKQAEQDVTKQVTDDDAYILAQETIDIWEEKLILDITAQTKECPDNYENLLDYKWAGSVDGCGCDFESNNVTQTIVVKGQCNSELLGFGCYDVDSQPQITASTWKNSKYLCAKRDSTYSLIDSLDQKCELGDIVTPDYKKCGSDQRAVCRKEGDECPVTNIQMSQQIVGSSTGESIEIDSQTEYIFYQDINGYMPIVGFRFDEYAHCLNQNQYNISPNKTGEYILLEKRRQNCYLEDPRPVELDNIGEEDFYKANEEMWKVATQKLPGYPRPSNQYNYKLSYMPYPYWSFACRNSEEYNLKEAKKRLLLQNESDEMENLVIVTIISVVFVSIILIFLEAKKEYYRQIELVQIAQFIINQIQFDRCGDEFFKNQIFPDYMRSINQMYKYLGGMLGLWWFIISVDVLIILFRYLYQIIPTNKAIKHPFPKQLAKKKQVDNDSFDMDDNIEDQSDDEQIMDDDSEDYDDDDDFGDEIDSRNEIENIKQTQKQQRQQISQSQQNDTFQQLNMDKKGKYYQDKQKNEKPQNISNLQEISGNKQPKRKQKQSKFEL
ncbi:DnaJ domain [Pseudocohnilembus persalinus]|uniref:DnaJ domain n=1 Tax=Pseudocohnilembus persalinus TaxID=266149 RepID=A0A0V0QB62_PSEPJ|nr:DnaJ domain [Pseudocohnilembus persalinus]|eukprot:KRW99465.1 DnaJ domain [Pseudocohnilembus persalinus]